MARTRAADYDAQRDRILALAVEAFANTGYAGATMALLAQTCGVSKATLYHYFPSKQALLFEALDRYTQRLVLIVEGVASRADSPEHALRSTLGSLMAEYRHSRAYHVALLQELRFLSPEQQRKIKAQERAVVGALTLLLERAAPGAMQPQERSLITMALLGMINFTFTWLRADGPVSHERFAELAASLWMKGLSGQAPGGLVPSSPESPHEQAIRLQG